MDERASNDDAKDPKTTSGGERARGNPAQQSSERERERRSPAAGQSSTQKRGSDRPTGSSSDARPPNYEERSNQRGSSSSDANVDQEREDVGRPAERGQSGGSTQSAPIE